MADYNFIKMQGLGNDFVILDARVSGFNPLEVNDIVKISDRRAGVGCDQLIVIENSERADAFMRIYNADGSESGACGNATRCVAHLVLGAGINGSIETLNGILPVERVGSLIKAGMGLPKFSHADIPLQSGLNAFNLQIDNGLVKDGVALSMGNPHCVQVVNDCEAIDITSIGAQIENHAAFPARTNVEFITPINRQKIRMRVWERGVGVTQACGSGACASAVTAILKGLCDKSVEVVMDGGSLTIEYAGSMDNPSHMVYMTGGYEWVFEGRIRL